MISARELYPFLDTPALVPDLDKIDANIKEMADIARHAGMKPQPHINSQSSPYIANCSSKLSSAPQSMSR